MAEHSDAHETGARRRVTEPGGLADEGGDFRGIVLEPDTELEIVSEPPELPAQPPLPDASAETT
ncbi:hypothetical protein [Nonomuraea sp. NPDC049400]|uniref:hypothetical protein n=1 Tax=Nonomuraea sp. NPDC049400 TaxID=3364352 RepID=UPI003796BB8D